MLPDRDAIESGRRRLLTALFVVLAGFASFAVAYSFMGPQLTDYLIETPVSVRVGILALALGLIGLVWERERTLARLGAARERQDVLVASYENRLESLEELMAHEDLPGSGPSLEDALRVVLDAAVDLSGAEGGAVNFMDVSGELGSRSYTRLDTQVLGRSSVQLPLTVSGRQVGDLMLVLPQDQIEVDEPAMEALKLFGEQAGGALIRASAVTRERQSVTNLQAASVVKSRFLNTVSHELRTPLTSIVGYASTLDNHWDRLPEEQKREFVRSVEFQAERLSRLVERILEAARVQMEGVTIRPILHDVRMSVSNALRPFLEAEGTRLEARMPDGPLEAEIDPFVVDQVVSNLVDNALRFTAGPVSVMLDGSRRSVRLTFIDRGEGIDPRRLEMVKKGAFDIGENFESGTGLGMHIVHRLIKDHGGEWEVRSGPSGTRIVVTLAGGYRPPKEARPPGPNDVGR